MKIIASGAGVRQGIHLRVIPITDVAPTIARLLGTTMGEVDGRALTEIMVGNR